jgi:hypothetical protein
MPGVISTNPKAQFLTTLGVPMVGGTLTTYIAGTTTLVTTWQDQALLTANTNPIVLDARGECVLWLDSAIQYKFVLKNALGITQWTQDNISGAVTVFTGIFTKASDLAASSGASLVGYLPGGVGTVARTQESKSREIITPEDFGAVGDGVSNDTAAFSLFAAAIKVVGGGRIPPKSYKVSQFIVDGANGLSIDWQGTLVGMATGTYDAVCTIKNSGGVSITGRIGIFGSYNTDYACGLALYTDNGTQCSNIDIAGIAITGVRRAIRASRSTEPNALVSEITINGGFTYGTPSVIEAWGTQTFVTINNVSMQSNDLGGGAPWVALDQYTIRAFGATVLINGGEVGHNQRTKNACICVEPITDATYGNNYGSITVVAAAIESASQLAVAQNTLGVASPVAGSGMISIQACTGYHSGNFFAFVQSAADFTGKIKVGGGCNFYAGPVRSQPNILANGNADIYCDDDAFGKNFLAGLSGITGGIVHFSKREILRALNCSGQSIPAATATTLKWQSPITGTDRNRFLENYSVLTGIFTVPTGGLKSVSLSGTYRTSQPTDVIQTEIYADGGYVGSFFTSMGGAGNPGIIRGYADLGDQPAGAQIYLKAVQSSFPAVTNFGFYEQMVISAAN